MKSTLFYGIVTTILFTLNCTQPPEYPDEPVIAFLNLSKNTVFQGSKTAPIDTLAITFSFTDGDGDLGDEDSLKGPNIILMDSRDSTEVPYKISPIPEQGSGNGISGEITLIVANKSKGVPNICCIIPDIETCSADPLFPRDTFSYLIRVRDQAERWSNTISTETITILCR